VKQGWILVSASGTVGRTMLATERLEKFFLTHDLIRIIPRQSLPVGYLYAFLSSWIGQALVAKDQYGSAIKHLEPHQLAGVPVPILPDQVQNDIHNTIVQAYALRDEANALLDKADERLHQELGLLRFDHSLVRYLPAPLRSQTNKPQLPHPRAFILRASTLEDRFDASYHLPVVQTIIDLLWNGKYKPVRLSRLVEKVYLPPRFKRIYVQRGHGIPFLRPSHLPQTRPHDLGYISRLTKELELLKLHEGDVMVTTDGTVGQIGLVTSHLTGWAGSNNIARITCDSTSYQNGFLAAFLSTPYGYHQLTREIYGGVVDHIEASQIESILVPGVPTGIQTAIGKLVVEAFEKKDEATAIEEAVIRKLEAELERAESQ
jgi:type I restriction enzyme S subunit